MWLRLRKSCVRPRHQKAKINIFEVIDCGAQKCDCAIQLSEMLPACSKPHFDPGKVTSFPSASASLPVTLTSRCLPIVCLHHSVILLTPTARLQICSCCPAYCHFPHLYNHPDPWSPQPHPAAPALHLAVLPRHTCWHILLPCLHLHLHMPLHCHQHSIHLWLQLAPKVTPA